MSNLVKLDFRVCFKILNLMKISKELQKVSFLMKISKVFLKQR